LFFTAGCQDALRRQRAVDVPPVGWPTEVLDSLSNPLFTQLVRDAQYTNDYGFTANDLVTYHDSVYAQRICRIASGVPLYYNKEVRNYIDLYAQRKKDLTERMLGKSAWYYPLIEPVLAAQQVPDVLKHLTMVESAMHLKAASPKSAVGLWQIRPATGRSLGLEISQQIDQRRDPVLSSRAAAAYLSELYERYGDWYLAIAAYNYGIGNIKKAMNRAAAATGEVPTTFLALCPYLPAETRSYVPAFVAVVYLYHYQHEHNLRPAYFGLPFQRVDTAYVLPPLSLAQAGDTYRAGVDELYFLNPALVQGVIPVQSLAYPLAVPIKDRAKPPVSPLPVAKPADSALVRQLARVVHRPTRVVPNPERMTPVVHAIQKGNSLAEIAEQYDCTVGDLMRWNSLYDATIWAGDELTVYVPRLTPEAGTVVRR
jgi:membrane-bound lytic murein transglycosylase D